MKHFKKTTTAIALGITLITAFSSKAIAKASEEYWYKVRKGESYYSIAEQFDIDVSDFNVEKTLNADNKIIIPGYVLEPHKVVKGDTIHSLAKSNNIKEDWILMANNMEEEDKIIIDHYLLIPIRDPEKDSGKATEKDSEKNSEKKSNGKFDEEKVTEKSNGKPDEEKVTENSTDKKSEEKTETIQEEYVIQNGDTLTKIANKLNVTVQELLSWNPKITNPNRIYFGKKIRIIPTLGTDNSSKPVETEMQTLKCDFSGLSSMIDHYTGKYKGLKIGVGIYDLSESTYLYKYKIDREISSACTVKAAYATYVLRQCTEKGLDLDLTKIMYRAYMMNAGSGRLKNFEPDQEFSVRTLLTYMLEISDNTAYNILLSKFDLEGFQKFLDEYDGQNLYGCRYGTCSVKQRMNEWHMINNYVNSTDPNGKVLKELLESAKYSYLAQGFSEEHNYLHKSGWADGKSYNSCSDAIIVDNRYIIVVISDDYTECIAHTDVVRNIGSWCDNYLF